MIPSKREISNYELSLGGQKLSINSDHSEEEMAKIASLANIKIKDSMNKDLSFQKSLMIALLQMSEEIITLKSDLKRKVEGLENQTESIIRNLERTLEVE